MGAKEEEEGLPFLYNVCLLHLLLFSIFIGKQRKGDQKRSLSVVPYPRKLGKGER